ncbi:conserved hypothetical protein [uncultured Mycobacterium sp.]|uniref:Uncharacterized protein n=1 Tax=uncultured Mycobacterium sp. TaxID=171292 RepID=A0A1Y5NW61_9MYCO|nr:conserved hypothetical protein [uncultured Mycobacterium sp.]
MTVEQPGIEALGDHDYLVHVPLDDDVVTIRMRATPEIVTRIGGADSDETRVIAATVAYLVSRQRADDLPEQLDLDDVAAAYDDYVADLHTQMANRANNTRPESLSP